MALRSARLPAALGVTTLLLSFLTTDLLVVSSAAAAVSTADIRTLRERMEAFVAEDKRIEPKEEAFCYVTDRTSSA